MDTNLSFSPLIKHRAGIRYLFLSSDSCYLGALVGWTSVPGSNEHLQGNNMKIIQVQNPHICKTRFYLSCSVRKHNKERLRYKRVSIQPKDKHLNIAINTKTCIMFPWMRVTQKMWPCNSKLLCPVLNPKPLVFPCVVLERLVVQTGSDPAGTRPERTSEHT